MNERQAVAVDLHVARRPTLQESGCMPGSVDHSPDPQLTIRAIELVFFKRIDRNLADADRLSSYLIAVTFALNGVEHVVIRNGFERNKYGRLSGPRRRLLHQVSSHLCDLSLPVDDRPETVRTALTRELQRSIKTIVRERRRSGTGLDWLRAQRWNRKRRGIVQGQLETFALTLDDVLVAVEQAPRSPGPVTVIDGVPEPVTRLQYLASHFTRINDYQRLPLPSRPELGGKLINDFDDFEPLRLLGKNGTKGYLYYYFALGFGLRTRRLSKFSLIASDARAGSMLFSWSTSQLSSIASHAICVNKEATRSIMDASGLPVPRGRAFSPEAVEAAQRYADLIGYPVVTKPMNGSKGEGVVVGIRDADELAAALVVLRRSVYRNSDFIVEKHVEGQDYRIVVVGDEVRGALLRSPASVQGDGIHSALDLMLQKHAWRMRNPHFIDRSAFIDEDEAFGLLRGGTLDLHRVPEAGEQVTFGTSCNLSQGADSIDVLDELHPSIADVALRAVRAVPGLRYCGVDLLLEDHTKPIDEQPAGIVELNAKAAIGNCEYPMFGHSRGVVRYMFSELAEEMAVELRPFSEGRQRIRCEIRGYLRGRRYRAWLRDTARELGVEVESLRQASRRQLDVSLVGDLAPVSMMATRLIIGPLRTRPTSVAVSESERLTDREPRPSGLPRPAGPRTRGAR